MNKVGVVYFTQSGITGQLAEAVIQGVQSFGSDCFHYEIQGKDIVEGRFVNPEVFEKLQECDAIVFGSPTYMGNVSAQFKAFADASSNGFSEQDWSNKVAAGFTCGGSVNGDQTSTLQCFSTLASQHGMIWANLDKPSGYNNELLNRLGSQIGVVAQGENGIAHPTDVATARYLGTRVAKIASLLHPVKPCCSAAA